MTKEKLEFPPEGICINTNTYMKDFRKVWEWLCKHIKEEDPKEAENGNKHNWIYLMPPKDSRSRQFYYKSSYSKEMYKKAIEIYNTNDFLSQAKLHPMYKERLEPKQKADYVHHEYGIHLIERISKEEKELIWKWMRECFTDPRTKSLNNPNTYQSLYLKIHPSSWHDEKIIGWNIDLRNIGASIGRLKKEFIELAEKHPKCTRSFKDWKREKEWIKFDFKEACNCANPDGPYNIHTCQQSCASCECVECDFSELDSKLGQSKKVSVNFVKGHNPFITSYTSTFKGTFNFSDWLEDSNYELKNIKSIEYINLESPDIELDRDGDLIKAITMAQPITEFPEEGIQIDLSGETEQRIETIKQDILDAFPKELLIHKNCGWEFKNSKFIIISKNIKQNKHWYSAICSTSKPEKRPVVIKDPDQFLKIIKKYHPEAIKPKAIYSWTHPAPFGSEWNERGTPILSSVIPELKALQNIEFHSMETDWKNNTITIESLKKISDEIGAKIGREVTASQVKENPSAVSIGFKDIPTMNPKYNTMISPFPSRAYRSGDIDMIKKQNAEKAKGEKEMNMIKRNEELEVATYELGCPGINKDNSKISVDTEKGEIIVQKLKEKKVTDQLIINVPVRYDTSNTKANITDGIVSITVPTKEGVVINVEVK